MAQQALDKLDNFGDFQNVVCLLLKELIDWLIDFSGISKPILCTCLEFWTKFYVCVCVCLCVPWLVPNRRHSSWCPEKTPLSYNDVLTIPLVPDLAPCCMLVDIFFYLFIINVFFFFFFVRYTIQLYIIC